jgi:hypothetical protein
MPTQRNRRVALRERKTRLLVSVDALIVGAIPDDDRGVTAVVVRSVRFPWTINR